jgi:hypothetical protein
MANRTTITIYTRQKTSLHAVTGTCILPCWRCNADVIALSPEQAAGVLQLTVRAVAELSKSGALHAITAPSGAPLICGNSLFVASAPTEKTSIEKNHEPINQ